jgi:hypothetical protein
MAAVFLPTRVAITTIAPLQVSLAADREGPATALVGKIASSQLGLPRLLEMRGQQLKRVFLVFKRIAVQCSPHVVQIARAFPILINS